MKLVQGENLEKIGIEVSDGLWLVPAASAERAVADAAAVCKERFDLPKDHPLYGKRVLEVVPAGSGDIEATAEGVKQVLSAVSAEPIKEEEEGVVK